MRRASSGKSDKGKSTDLEISGKTAALFCVFRGQFFLLLNTLNDTDFLCGFVLLKYSFIPNRDIRRRSYN